VDLREVPSATEGAAMEEIAPAGRALMNSADAVVRLAGKVDAGR
jgi:hypothetical protein